MAAFMVSAHYVLGMGSEVSTLSKPTVPGRQDPYPISPKTQIPEADKDQVQMEERRNVMKIEAASLGEEKRVDIEMSTAGDMRNSNLSLSGSPSSSGGMSSPGVHSKIFWSRCLSSHVLCCPPVLIAGQISLSFYIVHATWTKSLDVGGDGRTSFPFCASFGYDLFGASCLFFLVERHLPSVSWTGWLSCTRRRRRKKIFCPGSQTKFHGDRKLTCKPF